MTQLPAIYTIHASDAPQHTGRLEKILQRLKTENRIDGFTMLGADDDLSSLTDKIEEDDLVLIVLTNQLEPQKEQIENRLKTFKVKQPGLNVAEIIIDNLVYDNEFIIFPADLRPIRDRMDMDAVWSGIEQSLKDMFPPPPIPPPPVPWKKYVKYAALILVVAVLAWIIPKIIPRGEPKAHFTYLVGDADQDTITTCYLPCDVRFINESQNYDSIEWNIEDKVFNDKHLRLEFNEPGDVEIVLTAFKNKKKDTYRKKLLIKSPPVTKDTRIKELRGQLAAVRRALEGARKAAGDPRVKAVMGTGVSRQLGEVLEMLQPDRIEDRIEAIMAAGPARVFKRELETLKGAMTTTNQEMKEREVKMRRLKSHLSTLVDRGEIDPQTARSQLRKASEEHAVFQDLNDAVRQAYVSLEAAVQTTDD